MQRRREPPCAKSTRERTTSSGLSSLTTSQRCVLHLSASPVPPCHFCFCKYFMNHVSFTIVHTACICTEYTPGLVLVALPFGCTHSVCKSSCPCSLRLGVCPLDASPALVGFCSACYRRAYSTCALLICQNVVSDSLTKFGVLSCCLYLLPVCTQNLSHG